MPAYLNAEVQALSEQLERARERKQNLCDAGIATDEVDREILGLRRQLREGGQLRAGAALCDDRYLLIRAVGRGGFAVVWEAFDRVEQHRVAIKVLHQHLASEAERRERFFRGAREMMDLKHPAVVRVLEPIGEDDSFCYFVMELVQGGNLREAVLGNRVTPSRRLPLLLQVGEALAEAHRKRLVHRDIKPANILIDEQGNAKLTDFDLVGAQDTTGGTRTGLLGTVVYAAPECHGRPQDATARADVWGLGMTAIFCLAGQDLTMDAFRDAAGALAQLDCTVAVRNVLERAVEWKPECRFADAKEMVSALRDALGSYAERADSSGFEPEGAVVILPRPLGASDKKPAGDACLVNLHPPGPDIGRRIALLNPQYIVGRDSEAAFVVSRSSVSRQHARLYADDAGNWWVEDLNSTNGTFVNETRIKNQQLSDSDQVRFGDAIYKFLAGSNIEQAYHEAIHKMVIQDDLTGVHNSRYFREFLEREIAVCSRHGHPLTLVMFDVDHLKYVNYKHGQSAGDAVLKELAARIRPRIRPEDLFARYGGDEFVCVLPSTALAGGIAFAEHLLTLIAERPCVFHDVSISFTISLGVTTLHSGEDITGLIRRADEHLLAAKQGRNRVVPTLADVNPP